MNMMNNLEGVLKPRKINSIAGNVFVDGTVQRAMVTIKDGVIDDITQIISPGAADIDLTPDFNMVILPGGVSTHNHGRDAYEVTPKTPGSHFYKEDSFTLSLALAHGGATYGMCMPNLPKQLTSRDNYDKQLDWINTQRAHRSKPIMDLGMYALIMEGTEPFGDDIMYKLLWNTFGPTNLSSDDVLFETLQPYAGKWVTAHCETQKDILTNDALLHHEKRQPLAAINATSMFLSAAREIGFHPHIAHISTSEEMRMVQQYNSKFSGDDIRKATYEITPQVLLLDVENFSDMSGRDLVWGQQNPPLRTSQERKNMLELVYGADIFATDHAPHSWAEKKVGMSGMPQADTAGPAYMELVTQNHISLADFVEKWAIRPGEIVAQYFGHKVGKIEPGYDASFAIFDMHTGRQFSDSDIMSKCAWTPYANHQFSTQVAGTIVKGTAYTPRVLAQLRDDEKITYPQSYAPNDSI